MGIFDFIKNKRKSLINTESSIEELPTVSNLNTNTNTKTLGDNFYSDYYDKIKKYEDDFIKANSKIYEINDINLRIKQYEISIKLLNEFKEFCSSKGNGGELYFEDMWEHCHNSKNSDFKFINNLYIELEDLKNNKDFFINKFKKYEEIDVFKKIVDEELIDLISQNQGILQKDIYKHFKPHFKDSIQSALYFMNKNKQITREKFKNTYKLYLN